MGPKEFRTHAKAGFEAGENTSMATPGFTSHGVSMNLIHLLIIYLAYELFSPYQWD